VGFFIENANRDRSDISNLIIWHNEHWMKEMNYKVRGATGTYFLGFIFSQELFVL
jgi:hypothetical protein